MYFNLTIDILAKPSWTPIDLKFLIQDKIICQTNVFNKEMSYAW